MRTQTNFIDYKNHRIAYTIIGSGNQFIIAFHGVLLEKSAYDFLENLGDEYTILAFDLPFHGETEWQEPYILTPDLIAVFQLLKEQYQLERVHLLGYSIGARWVHVLIEHFAAMISSVVYVAPDSVMDNKFYSFATGNIIGKPIFKLMTHRTRWLHNLINTGERIKIIPPKQAKFIRTATGSEEKSKLIYKIWKGYATLDFNIAHVISNVNNLHIPTLLVIGLYDTIIKREHVQPLINSVKNIKVVTLEQTHHLLTPLLIPTLQQFYHEI